MRKLFDEINSRGIGCPFATFRHQHLHAMQIFQAQLLNLCVGLQKRDCIGMPLLNRKSLRKSRTVTPRNTWSGSIQRIPRTAPWYQLTGGFVKRLHSAAALPIRKVTHRKYNKSKYINVYKLNALN